MSEELITIVGSSYYQPVLDLIEKMLRQPSQKVVALRIGLRENGYALSIVLLLVIMLESYVGRVRYLQSKSGKEKSKKERKVPEYIELLRKSFGFKKSLNEVFVLRDAIAHGHVWKLTVSDRKAYGHILCNSSLEESYGDKKYDQTVNKLTRRTRILGLNIVPTAVGRKEVLKVLDMIWRTLNFLVKHKLIESNVTRFRGRYEGKPFDFWDIRKVIKASLEQ
ncbi:MAG: hypothetical protein VB032_06450 [Burkholderiaceae bacterium]|nr:hypothetical protein [Burkholderiaceae bacterium]